MKSAISESSSSKTRKRNWDETKTVTVKRTLASRSSLAQLKSPINPNFEELAATYPNFKSELCKLRQRQVNSAAQNKHSTKKSSSSFTFAANVDFDFNLALSRAILDKYFQLNLKCVPKGYLCPPIPNRFNYILWLKDLIQEIQRPTYFTDCPAKLAHRGIDLGTGVSCIYPLLLSRRDFTAGQRWQFLGTDIDPFSIQCAQENIDANGLEKVIKVALVPPAPVGGGCRTVPKTNINSIPSSNKNEVKTPLNTAMIAANQTYLEDQIQFDFCMTNPPFYSTKDEASLPRSGDDRDRIDMTFNESVYPGGEVGFALDMIYDSFNYRDRVCWYTLMLSKKSSLITLEKQLITLGFHLGQIRTAEFIQGKITRWGIAWTFLTPNLRSPALKLVGGLHVFTVSLDCEMTDEGVMKDISNRIICFAEELKMVDLKCEQNARNHVVLTEKCAKADLHAENIQVLIDVYIDYDASAACSSAVVRLESFGNVNLVRKIQGQLEGEICRTNRRWRRIKKKKSQL